MTFPWPHSSVVELGFKIGIGVEPMKCIGFRVVRFLFMSSHWLNYVHLTVV